MIEYGYNPVKSYGILRQSSKGLRAQRAQEDQSTLRIARFSSL